MCCTGAFGFVVPGEGFVKFRYLRTNGITGTLGIDTTEVRKGGGVGVFCLASGCKVGVIYE